MKIRVLMIRFFLIALLIVTFTECEIKSDSRYPIFLNNNGTHSIDAYLALGGNMGIQYPDTILPMSNKNVITGIKKKERFIYSSGLEWSINLSNLAKDTVSIYFFHSDTLSTYSWEEVREKNKILKRYDLSLEDLEMLNFEVAYPPTPQMENIKQYPAFN